MGRTRNTQGTDEREVHTVLVGKSKKNPLVGLDTDKRIIIKNGS